MAVYTEVSFTEARDLLRRLSLGELHDLRGIQGGIENTNYFATVLPAPAKSTRSAKPGTAGEAAETAEAATKCDYVLTLFERLTAEQLPFYLYLMKHLAQRGIPVPDPQGDKNGNILHTVNGKPAAVVNRLPGTSELAPTAVHSAAVGDMLARMHLAGRDFDRYQPNLRGLDWWNDTAPAVMPHLGAAQAALLQGELAYQNHVAASSAYAALPRGPVHADLFRDNAMFDNGLLSGFFDFYFAGTDAWLFDLAVCLNDWCIDLATGSHHAERADAFIGAYSRIRPFSAAERYLLPAMLRGAALRFWISRLWDFYLPRDAALLQPHDPAHFERVLRCRVAQPCAAGLTPAAPSAPLPSSVSTASCAAAAASTPGPAT